MAKPKNTAGAPGPSGTKPTQGDGGGIPPRPTSPPPEGYEWQLQQDPNNPQKFAWAPVIAAGISAIGGYLSARQSNKPRTSETNQTTVQTPYRPDLYQSDIEAILNLQRQLINEGPGFVGGANARPQYQAAPNSAPPRMERSDERLARNINQWRNEGGGGRVDPQPGGGGGGGGIGRGAGSGGDPEFGPGAPVNFTGPVDFPLDKKFGAYSASQLATDPKLVNKLSPADLKAYNAAKRGGGAGGGGTTGPAPGGAPAINYRDPTSIAGEVARQGFQAGNDPTTRAAEGAVRNILSGQGGAGSGTGFQGYNPINDELAQRLLADPTNADELLRQFLGPAGKTGAAGGPAGKPDPNDPYAAASGGGGYRIVNFGTGGPFGGGSGAPSGGGAVPDTVGGSNSYFAQQIKDLMDAGASGEDVQTIIDAQSADINRGLSQSLWDLDAAAQGTGRLGGDTWAGLGRQARGDAVRQMGTFAAKTRLDELSGRRAFQQGLLGQVNARDIAAMQDLTNRYGIDASSASAGAGSAEANATARRGQDLQALGMLLQNQQYGSGQLADLGGRLSTDQLSSIGMAPDLAGVHLAGLGAANQAAGTQAGLAASRMQAGVARGAQNLQAQMFNSGLRQEQLNNYLRTVMGVGGMGGTSHTEGTNVQPGLGVNPTAAAIQGGVGGYLAMYGRG